MTEKIEKDPELAYGMVYDQTPAELARRSKKLRTDRAKAAADRAKETDQKPGDLRTKAKAKLKGPMSGAKAPATQPKK